MKLPALILIGLALAPLGGCIGTPGPTALSAERTRTVRVPTTLTGGSGQASTLILGVQ